MPAYNFQKQFAPMIESGKKRHTIRKLRKSGNIKAGDTLYLYTNQRTVNCRKLGEHKCLSVHQISIDEDFVLVDGHSLSGKEIYDLALADGFDSIAEFMEFFDYQYSLPFDGVLIKW